MEQKPTRNKLSDYQVLTDYVNGKIDREDLTFHQQNKLKRVTLVYDQLLDAQSNNIIIERLQDNFQLSMAQAWRDLHLSEALFGNLRQSNKAMKRQIAENMALETYRQAKRTGDLKAMAAANRNYIAATGIENEDLDLPDFDKLQPNIYAVVLDDDVRQLFTDFIQNSGGSLDLTKLIEKAEDAQIVEDTQPERTD